MKLLCLLLAVPGLALARIGETAAELDARYGKPVRTFSGSFPAAEFEKRSYESAGISVEAYMWQGKCHRENYSHTSVSPLTPVEVDALMAANAGGRVWKLSSIDRQGRTWVLEDLGAYHMTQLGALEIYRRGFPKADESFFAIDKALQDERDKPRRDELKGF